MTGVFEIWIKRPKENEVIIPPPDESPMQERQRFPDMKDSDRFDYEHLKDVELPGEIWKALQEWWWTADFCEEFIVRCELPT